MHYVATEWEDVEKVFSGEKQSRLIRQLIATAVLELAVSGTRLPHRRIRWVLVGTILQPPLGVEHSSHPASSHISGSPPTHFLLSTENLLQTVSSAVLLRMLWLVNLAFLFLV